MNASTKPQPARSAKDQFDRQAAHYDDQWNSWSQELLNWLIDHSHVKPTDRVLDVATGTGFTALAFAARAAEVVGLDVSPGMLAQSRKHAQERGISNAKFIEGPAENMPFPDASFDIVTVRVAPHHFLDINKFASETARVLKPDGRLVVADTTVPDGDPEPGNWENNVNILRDPSHVRNYTPNEWREIVAGAGLDVREATNTGGGITIPLEDWIFKAGCTPDQAIRVREAFEKAPESARKAFKIRQDESGQTIFTWQRVVLEAVKPG